MGRIINYIGSVGSTFVDLLPWIATAYIILVIVFHTVNTLRIRNWSYDTFLRILGGTLKTIIDHLKLILELLRKAFSRVQIPNPNDQDGWVSPGGEKHDKMGLHNNVPIGLRDRNLKSRGSNEGSFKDDKDSRPP